MQTTATTQTAVTSTGNARETSRARSEEENLASFGRALDQLHAELRANDDDDLCSALQLPASSLLEKPTSPTAILSAVECRSS